MDDLQIVQLPSLQMRARRWGSEKRGALGSIVQLRTSFRKERSRLVRQIVGHARTWGAEQVFAVLDNPMTMGLAHRVSDELGLPLVTLVWDPPDYLLRQAKFDRWSRAFLVREFQRSLAASRRIAVVSETMQEDYAAHSTAPIQLLRHGLAERTVAETASVSRLPGDEWVIGFAGTMYSDCAWRAFLMALDSVDWRIAGRPVRLKLLTSRIEVASRASARIEYLGFRSPEEVQAHLAACHLFYMPQPFVPHLRDLCRYSFPTKLSNYLALGRPVFVHSPPDGALSRFIADHPIGVQAGALDPASIVAALQDFLIDEARYADACREAKIVAEKHFSRRAFHAAVDALLGGGA